MSTKHPEMAKRIPLIFSLISLGFLIVGGILLYRTYRIDQTYVKVDGEVVDHIMSKCGRRLNGTCYSRVVQFETDDGESVEFIEGSASGGSLYEKEFGSVQVKYPEGEPEKAIIDDFLNMWMLPSIFLGFGLIWGALTLLLAKSKIIK